MFCDKIQIMKIVSLLLCIGVIQNVLCENNNPIIGVMTQEVADAFQELFPGLFHSHLAASYVKLLEGSGARVVPIWIGKPRAYYEQIMNNINGVFFPGGGADFTNLNGYMEAGKNIWDIAVEMNERGDYFPLWGTCLGFELFSFYSSNLTEHRDRCSAVFVTLPLVFAPGYRQSRLFGKAPLEITTALSTQLLTVNNHRFCLTMPTFERLGLLEQWSVLSLNADVNKLVFISSMEHKRYPFFGSQFHPEKNSFEWYTNQNLPHSKNAIKTSQYFGNFFVDECRKSSHKFPSISDEYNHLIENFHPVFTGRHGSSFLQTYLFMSGDDYATGQVQELQLEEY